MNKLKVIKGKLIVLGILFVLTFVACDSNSQDDNKNAASNFVVTQINPVVTSVPTDETQSDIEQPDKKQEGDLYTLSSVKDFSASAKQEDSDKMEIDIIGNSQETNEVIENKEDEVQIFLESIGSVQAPKSYEGIDDTVVDSVKAMPAASIVRFNSVNAATVAACFYEEKITPAVYLRMENKSYSEVCKTPIDSLRYVRVLHFGFDGEIYIGELVVSSLISSDIIDIFKELFDAGYPIEHMVLVDDYDADDNLSMEANNTSSFNYRVVEGTSKLSKHAYGLAIDINPLYNPYIRTVNGKEVILPENGSEYADRTLECEYYITEGDVCYNAFIKRGFTWGGNWEDSKDYQHFQKVFDN